MGNRSTYVRAAVVVSAMLGSLGLAGAATPQAAGAPAGLHDGAAVRGAQLWASRYDGPVSEGDSAAAVAAGPDGETVYVTGSSAGTGAFANDEYATVAYQASTGARLWARRYDNPGSNMDNAVSVAVSPGGGRVFVTGYSTGAGDGGVATVAYSATTGALLWAARYHSPHGESVSSMAVSPDGKTVFITGDGYDAALNRSYVTIAYSAATGARQWVRFFSGHRSGFNAAVSVAVSPSGKRVFVTGDSKGASELDYATVAYNAATGAQLWVSRYNGPADSRDEATSVTASPGGGTVFVTGSSVHSSNGPSWDLDYATVAYNAATGARLWVRRYNGPGKSEDSASSVVAGPDGKTVYVTGASDGARTYRDWATVAYSAATGTRLWVKRYDGPASSEDFASALAASPDGKTVYVTGSSMLGPPDDRTAPYEYVTIAYTAATGTRLWARQYHHDTASQDNATGVAVSPAGTVFVTGSSAPANSDYDYATIAYRG